LEQIKISHEKLKEIIFRIFKSDYSITYDESFWNGVGLRRVDKFKNGGVYFEVLDKTKLVHAMIKYDFTI
jgi:hypothetical protein